MLLGQAYTPGFFFKALICWATEIRTPNLTSFFLKQKILQQWVFDEFVIFFLILFFKIWLVLNWSLFFYHIIKIK
jgi:hypothetical protein